MYPQKLQALYFLDAQRILELQHIHELMAKQHHVCRNESYEPIRQLARVEHVRRSPGKPFTSFNICDILSSNDGTARHSRISERQDTIKSRDYRLPNSSRSNRDNNRVRDIYNTIPNNNSSSTQTRIIRPWSRSPPPTSPSSDGAGEDSLTQPTVNHNIVFSPGVHQSDCVDDEIIDVEHYDDESEVETDSPRTSWSRDSPGTSRSGDNKNVSPLDALMAMSSKTFKGLEAFDHQRNGEHEHGKNNIPKKKRKTRTAFTNQQIYELEKRFIMQKYLTPADRDDISAKLGLSCAQVITWFQNRRAKFKRDIEEMKNDVGAKTPEPSDEKDKSDV